MKSVGKQLEEARLAKNWTPELAARETKIKVDRVRDLEVDDYSNFSSPTYARGFVRTYARALGIDEYKILRQLDNKLPEDDNASFANDSGLPYVPEPSQAVHVSSASRTGLYIVLGLGAGIVALGAFVLVQAYRIGEFPRYFASASDTLSSAAAVTNAAPIADAEAPAHALPVDPNDTTHSVRAMPVDLNNPGAPASTNAAPAVATDSTTNTAVAVATPANTNVAIGPLAPEVAQTTTPTPSDTNATAAATPPSTNASPVVANVDTSRALPALPVSPDALTNAPTTTVASATPPPDVAPTPPPAPHATTSSARASNSGITTTSQVTTKAPPRALPVDPSELAQAAPNAPTLSPVPETPAAAAPPGAVNAPTSTPPPDVAPTGGTTQLDLTPATAPDNAAGGKPLTLTASRDSFVRVTRLDAPEGQGVLFASVLRSGQSLSFNGRKFSVNVGIPSAVDITLDGVNYGPHSDHESPETFVVQSHVP